MLQFAKFANYCKWKMPTMLLKQLQEILAELSKKTLHQDNGLLFCFTCIVVLDHTRKCSIDKQLESAKLSSKVKEFWNHWANSKSWEFFAKQGTSQRRDINQQVKDMNDFKILKVEHQSKKFPRKARGIEETQGNCHNLPKKQEHHEREKKKEL